jgi:hypothetical protein
MDVLPVRNLILQAELERRIDAAQLEAELVGLETVAAQDRFDDLCCGLVLIDARGTRQPQTRNVRFDHDPVCGEILRFAGLAEVRDTAGKGAGFGCVGWLDGESRIAAEVVCAGERDVAREIDGDVVRIAEPLDGFERHHRQAFRACGAWYVEKARLTTRDWFPFRHSRFCTLQSIRHLASHLFCMATDHCG